MLDSELLGDIAAEGHRSSAGYRSRRRENPVLERESFRGILLQRAIEVGGYRSRGREKAVPEKRFWEDIAVGTYRSRGGYRSKGGARGRRPETIQEGRGRRKREEMQRLYKKR